MFHRHSNHESLASLSSRINEVDKKILAAQIEVDKASIISRTNNIEQLKAQIEEELAQIKVLEASIKISQHRLDNWDQLNPPSSR